MSRCAFLRELVVLVRLDGPRVLQVDLVSHEGEPAGGGRRLLRGSGRFGALSGAAIQR